MPTASYLGIWSVRTVLQRPPSLFSSWLCLVRLLFTAEECIFTLVSFAPLQVSILLSHSLILVSFAPLQSPWSSLWLKGPSFWATQQYESGMAPSFWGEALASFIHVSNKVTTAALSDETPHEAFYEVKPDVSRLQVWGCTSYILIQRDKSLLGSLEAHMEKCNFIEYTQGYKACCLWAK